MHSGEHTTQDANLLAFFSSSFFFVNLIRFSAPSVRLSVPPFIWQRPVLNVLAFAAHTLCVCVQHIEESRIFWLLQCMHWHHRREYIHSNILFDLISNDFFFVPSSVCAFLFRSNWIRSMVGSVVNHFSVAFAHSLIKLIECQQASHAQAYAACVQPFDPTFVQFSHYFVWCFFSRLVLIRRCAAIWWFNNLANCANENKFHAKCKYYLESQV